ncbi:MAG: alpha/beta hydrolase family protein, partial [[Clostridium] innocuum]
VQHIMNYVLYQSDFPSQKDVEKVNLINYISQDTVPMFLWHSIDDPVIDAGNSTRFISKLLEYGISAEYHLFGHGEHGKALENSLTHKRDEMIDHHLNSWISLADYWMNRIGEK